MDTRSQKKDGSFPVKLSISFNGRRLIVPTDISVPSECWDGKQVIFHSNRRAMNRHLNEMQVSVYNLIIRLRDRGELRSLTLSRLRSIISEGSSDGVISKENYLVCDHFKRFISGKVKKSTIEIYQLTLDKILLYEDGGPSLMFSDVTFSWLKDFDLWLSGSCGINTRSIHMRNLRAVFNDAINEDMVSQAIYPFRRFKIKKEETIKRSLSVSDLRILMDFPCEEYQRVYRDLFMLSFYLIGINMVDMLSLTAIRGERVEYRRSKTNKLYSILINPEAMEIIERYRGNDYLLNIMDRYENYKDFVHRMNYNLGRIGPVEIGANGKKIIHPLFPDLTAYWARHTWATVAGLLDIPKETISASLGHEIGSKTTGIYIDFDMKKVDDANRKVIDFVINNKR